jgi:(1->4)-alpha-D-glucan 1-alpha-D-glucosylmutase
VTPRATIRLQLNRGFTFDHAAARVAYFGRLGVSHVYASPILKARPGSLHGYDVVDPGLVNPELGGEHGLRRLVEALRRHGLGLILDIVPNHMAIHRQNERWLDVLENGPASAHASFFDIDWQSPDPSLTGKVLVPVLGAPYAEILRERKISLRLDARTGRILAEYGDHLLPIRPEDWALLLRRAGGSASSFAAGLAETGADPRDRAMARHKLAHAVQRDPAIGEAIDEALAGIAQHAEDPGPLHELLERQNFKLAWWRVAGDEVNWRRFFDINELIGVRVERPEVFDEVHEVTLRLYEEGLIDGLRVDHVDGLTDPGGYCRRLRDELAARQGRRPAHAPGGAAYLVVEKILATGERLPSGWPVDGTTGYDFMNEVTALLHDASGGPALKRLWHEISGRPEAFETEEETARAEVLERHFAGQLEAAADALHRAARLDLRSRDTARAALRRSLVALLRIFPYYRTYATRTGAAPGDAPMLDAVLARSRAQFWPADAPALDWIVALLRRPRYDAPEQGAAVVRFQQLSAPLAAKAVEDTAFYRYGRLLSRNDVGSDPARLGSTPVEFHRIQVERAAEHPATMLATATHDHKRGEDTRARLAVLSELPALWKQKFHGWLADNGWARPDRLAAADEYLLYQMIVGAWPLELAPDNRTGLASFAERLAQWQQKALREAKLRSSWIAPDPGYEANAERFLRRILDPDASAPFLASIHGFVSAIASAGALNGLTQTLLRCTVPGVPDLYQGTEFWDFSLVDPDNRREVDFDARAIALAAGGSPAALLPSWRNGAVKQATIATALRVRRDLPELFATGTFEQLGVDGKSADRIYAFLRRAGSDIILVAVARHCAAEVLDECTPLPPPYFWRDTAIILPAELGARQWRDELTGGTSRSLTEHVRVAELFAAFPAALCVAA